MSIKKQLLLGLSLLFTGICLAVFLTIYFIVLPHVLQQERQMVITNLDRISEQLDNEIRTLSNFAKDWGYWDDTYKYAATPYPEYEESNFPAVLENTGTDLFYLVDRNGQVLKGIMDEQFKFKPSKAVTNDILSTKHWPDYHPLRKQSPALLRGIISTEYGPMLFAKSPILSSEGEGESHGELIYGKFLQATLIQKLNKQLKLTFDFRIIKQPPAHSQTTKVDFINNNLIKACANLPLYESDQYVLKIELEQERPMFQQMLTTLIDTQIVIIITGAILSACAYLYLNHTLVKPIIKLKRQAEQYDQHKNPETFSFLSHNNEMGELSGAFVQMARNIETHRCSLEEERSHFKDASLKDPLTGLYNRRYMMQFMERCGIPTNINKLMMLIDIDHFKQVNDQHGHNAGDQILQQFGNILSEQCRDTDVAIRYGGEEFLLIFHDTNEQAACRIAERIRDRVENYHFIHDQGNIRLTTSLGFFSFKPEDTRDAENNWNHCINIADLALYASKRSGRNTWIGLQWPEGNQNIPLPTESTDIPRYLADQKLTVLSHAEDKTRIIWF